MEVLALPRRLKLRLGRLEVHRRAYKTSLGHVLSYYLVYRAFSEYSYLRRTKKEKYVLKDHWCRNFKKIKREREKSNKIKLQTLVSINTSAIYFPFRNILLQCLSILFSVEDVRQGSTRSATVGVGIQASSKQICRRHARASVLHNVSVTVSRKKIVPKIFQLLHKIKVACF